MSNTSSINAIVAELQLFNHHRAANAMVHLREERDEWENAAHATDVLRDAYLQQIANLAARIDRDGGQRWEADPDTARLDAEIVRLREVESGVKAAVEGYFAESEWSRPREWPTIQKVARIVGVIR